MRYIEAWCNGCGARLFREKAVTAPGVYTSAERPPDAAHRRGCRGFSHPMDKNRRPIPDADILSM